MTKAQRQFVSGGARPVLVLALMAAGLGGGGYMARSISIGEADARAEARNRYEDLMQAYTDLSRHCEEREIDARGKGGGR